jgi:hypothetical protein
MRINTRTLLTLAVVVAVVMILYICTNSQQSNAELFEFTEEPDDSEGPMDQDEREDFMDQYQAYQLEQNADMQNVVDNNIDFNMNPQAYSYAYEAGAIRDGAPNQYTDNVDLRDDLESPEEFRVARGGRGGGRGGGSGGGRGGGSRTPMARGGGSYMRGGRRGSRRGSRRHRPRHYRHGRRPWRPYYWRKFPYYYYPYNYYSYYYTPYYPAYAYDYNPYFYPGYPMDDDYPAAAATLRYSVRITPKQATHPYSARGFPKGYSIIGTSGGQCGVSGAELTLKRGITYEFDIFTGRDCITGEPEHEPFFFTTDPAGGKDAGRVFNIKPTVNGVLRITPDENTPDTFFYNSSNHRFVGGIVRIV